MSAKLYQFPPERILHPERVGKVVALPAPSVSLEQLQAKIGMPTVRWVMRRDETRLMMAHHHITQGALLAFVRGDMSHAEGEYIEQAMRGNPAIDRLVLDVTRAIDMDTEYLQTCMLARRVKGVLTSQSLDDRTRMLAQFYGELGAGRYEIKKQLESIAQAVANELAPKTR